MDRRLAVGPCGCWIRASWVQHVAICKLLDMPNSQNLDKLEGWFLFVDVFVLLAAERTSTAVSLQDVLRAPERSLHMEDELS